MIFFKSDKIANLALGLMAGTLFFTLNLKAAELKQPNLLTKECKDFIKTLPADYESNWVTVPENWDDPKSNKIEVFYYTNYRPGKIPVVFFNGGPLSDSHGSHQDFEKFVNDRNIGMIYIDQRGTGCSTPIKSGKTTIDLQTASYYGTYEVAKDADKIRRALLNNQPWKVFGQSHGGMIVNRYLMLFPQNVMSAHVYAGGVNENFTDFYFYRMRAQYDIISAHEYQFPGTKERIRKAKRKLESDHVCIDIVDKKVCGSVILDAMFLSLSGLPSLVKPTIDAVINEKGEPQLNAIEENFSYAFEYFFTDQFYAAQALLRQEISSVDENMVLSKDCQAAHTKLFSQYRISQNDLVIDECNVISYAVKNGGAQSIFEDSFKFIPIRQQITHQKIKESISRFPNLKYYTYTSGMDPFVSLYAILDFAMISKQIVHKHYPWLGHGGYRFQSEVWDDMVASENK